MRRFVTLFMLSALTALSLNAQIQKEKVQFESGQWTVKGTLTYPKDGGQFPVFVIIHGSGPRDRDGTTPITSTNQKCLHPQLAGDTVYTYQDLATALTRKGYGVLRYDKRTYTYGAQLDLKQASPYDFVKDAGNAVEYLKSHPKVEQDKLFLIGHSQGANFLPLLADQYPGIAAVISLAGASKPIDSVAARQSREIITRCRGDTALADQQYQKFIRIMQQVRNGTWDENTPIMGVYPQFWRDWINITDSTVHRFREAGVPTLFIYGQADFNVPPEHGQRFEQHLSRDPVGYYYLDSMTHFLTPIDAPNIMPKLPDTIQYWLDRHNLTSTNNQGYSRPQLNVRYMNNSVVIKAPVTYQEGHLRIYNEAGQLMRQRPISGKHATINSANYAKGFYLVEVMAKDQTFVGKVMLE